MKLHIHDFIESDHTVTSKAQMIVALREASKQSFEEAKRHPFTVRWESTLFTFKEGLQTRRAEELVNNIKRNAKKWVNA